MLWILIYFLYVSCIHFEHYTKGVSYLAGSKPDNLIWLSVHCIKFLLTACFDPDIYASAPGHKHAPDWVCTVVGIFSFIDYNLDGMEGEQAYRTNSNTPWGELLDHSLKSWSCVYFVVTMYFLFGWGLSVSVFCSLSPAMDSFVFFLSVPLGNVSQGFFSCHGGTTLARWLLFRLYNDCDCGSQDLVWTVLV